MNRIFRYTIFYLLIFLVIIGIFGTFNGGNTPTEELTYHQFLTALDEDKIKEALIQPDNGVYVVDGVMKGAKRESVFLLTYLKITKC